MFVLLGERHQQKESVNRVMKGNIENCEENGKYFLYLSMEDQIKDLLQNEKVKKHLTNCSNRSETVGPMSDVTSSMLYRKLLENHNLSIIVVLHLANSKLHK